MKLGELVDRKINEIQPYGNNTKKHPPEQIEQIANSIVEFGFADPILVNEKGIIIAGHGRYEASKKLKLKSVPVITIYELSENQEKALRIAHNKLTMNSGFDSDKLKIEVEKLLDEGFNLNLTGFSDDEFSEMLGKLSTPSLVIEDDDKEYDGGDYDEEDNDNYSGGNRFTNSDKNYSGDDEYDYEEESPESEVRMLNLYLNDAEREELIDKIEKLNNHYHTSNPTACVLECVRECYTKYI